MIFKKRKPKDKNIKKFTKKSNKIRVKRNGY